MLIETGPGIKRLKQPEVSPKNRIMAGSKEIPVYTVTRSSTGAVDFIPPSLTQITITSSSNTRVDGAINGKKDDQPPPPPHTQGQGRECHVSAKPESCTKPQRL